MQCLTFEATVTIEIPVPLDVYVHSFEEKGQHARIVFTATKPIENVKLREVGGKFLLTLKNLLFSGAKAELLPTLDSNGNLVFFEVAKEEDIAEAPHIVNA